NPDPGHRNTCHGRILAAIDDVTTEFLAEVAEVRVRLRIVTLQTDRRIDHAGEGQNRNNQEKDAVTRRGFGHGRLHPVLSLKASTEIPPSLVCSPANCQLGNNFTPAALHAGASSPGLSLIAHST